MEIKDSLRSGEGLREEKVTMLVEGKEGHSKRPPPARPKAARAKGRFWSLSGGGRARPWTRAVAMRMERGGQVPVTVGEQAGRAGSTEWVLR